MLPNIKVDQALQAQKAITDIAHDGLTFKSQLQQSLVLGTLHRPDRIVRESLPTIDLRRVTTIDLYQRFDANKPEYADRFAAALLHSTASAVQRGRSGLPKCAECSDNDD